MAFARVFFRSYTYVGNGCAYPTLKLLHPYGQIT